MDEMVVKIGDRRLWRSAVDDEGKLLGVLIQKRRNVAAAMKLLRLLKNQAQPPTPSGPLSAKPFGGKTV